MAVSLFLYLCILIYSITFSILYDTYSTFLLAVLLGVLFVLFFIVGCIQHFFIRVSLEPVSTLVKKGDCSEVLFTVTNRLFLPVNEVKIHFSYRISTMKLKKDSVSLSLKGKSTVKAVFKIPAEFCGPVHIKMKGFSTFDLWHLTSIPTFSKKKHSKEITFCVVPELKLVSLPSDFAPPSHDAESNIYSKTKKGDDPSEIFDIREYQPGDKIQRIHWKLSSKCGLTMVKDFSLPISTRLSVLVNPASDEKTTISPQMLDSILEEAMRFSYTLITYEMFHNLYWCDYHHRLQQNFLQNEEDLFGAYMQLICSFDLQGNYLPAAYSEAHPPQQQNELYLFGAGKNILLERGYRV